MHYFSPVLVELKCSETICRIDDDCWQDGKTIVRLERVMHIASVLPSPVMFPVSEMRASQFPLVSSVTVNMYDTSCDRNSNNSTWQDPYCLLFMTLNNTKNYIQGKHKIIWIHLMQNTDLITLYSFSWIELKMK